MVLAIRNKDSMRLTLYFGMNLDVDPMPISEMIFSAIRVKHEDDGYKTDMFGIDIDGGNTMVIDTLMGEMIERGYEFLFVDEDSYVFPTDSYTKEEGKYGYCLVKEENYTEKYTITFATSDWNELYAWVETL